MRASRIELNDGTSVEPCVFDTVSGFDCYTGPMQLVYVLYRSSRKAIQRVDVHAFKSYGKEYDRLCADGMRGMIDYLGISPSAWTGDLRTLGPSSANSLIDRVCLEGMRGISYPGTDPAWCRADRPEEEGEVDELYRGVPDFPLSYRLVPKGCWLEEAMPARAEVYGVAVVAEDGFNLSANPKTSLWGTEPAWLMERELDEPDKFVLLYNDGKYDWF